MNLRDLKYFVALADSLHFSKAAKACFVSQPSLSIQIKKLETTLGVDLLERSSRSVLLTDIGKIIAEQARELLQRAAAIQEAAKQAQDPFSGEFNLGVIPTLTNYLLPHLMPQLSKTESFPKLSIYLAEQPSKALLQEVKHGKLDAALISLPISKDDLIVQPLFKEELLLATSKKHPLAKQKSITPSDIQGEALLLLEEGHCLREQALALCQQAAAEEAKHFRAANLEILRYMVASNLGITLMPSLATNPKDELCYLPFNKARPTRTIAMAWRASSPKKQLLMKMVDHIRRILAKQKGIEVLGS